MKISIITFLFVFIYKPTPLNETIKNIESYIQYINKGSNDTDALIENEKAFELNSFAFKESSTETFSTFSRKSIVKIKIKDYLQNNFIKQRSFYFKDDVLVCVKINELLHKSKSKVNKYTRTFYFNNEELILDTNSDDDKYNTNDLLLEAHFVLQEQYDNKKEPIAKR